MKNDAARLKCFKKGVNGGKSHLCNTGTLLELGIEVFVPILLAKSRPTDVTGDEVNKGIRLKGGEESAIVL